MLGILGLLLVLTTTCTMVSSCSKAAPGGQTDKQKGNDNDDNTGSDGNNQDAKKNKAYMPDQPGTLLTYTVTSGDEAGAGSLVEFVDIHDSAGYRVGYLEAVAAGVKLYGTVKHNDAYTYTVSYVAPMYYEVLKTLAATYNTFSHKETPLALKLPHEDPLQKVVFPTTVSAEWHGIRIDEDSKEDDKMIQTEFEAVIDSTGEIETEAGIFKDCIRVHYLRNQQRIINITSPDQHFSMDNTSHFDMMIWMVKGIGPVRTIELNLDTGITTVTDLTKIQFPSDK